MLRHAILVWHRWVGLALAAFLIVEGLTGSLLVFREPLAHWLAPHDFARGPAGSAPLPLATLATIAEARAPEGRVGYFSVEDHQAVMRVYPRDATSGRSLGWHLMILDPWTGRELRRLQGDRLDEGPVGWLGLAYDLHQNLLLGEWGTFVLGLVALAWTIDCFLAVVLTLPKGRHSFLKRWRKAFAIKRRGSSSARLAVDLHRAGSLWLWLFLLVFAWSGVMLTLPLQVYDPVTSAVLDTRTLGQTMALVAGRAANATPHLDWHQAELRGAALMADAARAHHFRVLRPYGMAYIREFGVYTYAVVTDANIGHHDWECSLWLDAGDGHLVSLELPSGQHPGNTLGNWLHALHYADLADNLAYRWAVFAAGIALAVLSATGVLIWLVKRRARRRARQFRTDHLATMRTQQ